MADDETSGAVSGGVPPDVTVGVVAAPVLPDGLTAECVRDLGDELGARHPQVHWRLRLVRDPLVAPPASDAEIVAAARRSLLDGDWDLVLVLTDLPLQAARRPVVAHASPLHGVAVLSLPALGTVGLRHKARDALLRLLGVLLGEARDDGSGERAARARSARITRRLRELASEGDEQAHAVLFTTRVITGHLGLLLGMVRANRPWQLARGLSRALVAAGAAGAFALVTPDVWRIADAFGWLRLVAVSVLAVTALTVTLVLGARLWERADRPEVRQQVVLFNLATSATVLAGVSALYVALLALSVLAALPLVVPRMLAETLGHPVALPDYLEVAWLTASLATIGGALGAGLESDDAVHRAAYKYRTSTATESEAAGWSGIGTSADIAAESEDVEWRRSGRKVETDRRPRVTRTGDFPLRTSYAAQRQMTQLAFALLRMQANTPAGEWVDERSGDEYREIWERVRSLAGEQAAEDLVLTLLTQAHVLLAYLVAATGISEAEWLDRIRADYVDRIPSDGTGVWGPHELRLGG